MKKILFAIQLPPPIHGASVVNKTLTDNKKVNQLFSIDIIQIQLANSMEDMGRFSIKKIINAFIIFFKMIKKISLNKYHLIYFTLSPLGFAFYKDLILIFIIKTFTNSKIIYHLHGKGIKEELNSKFKKKLYKYVFKNTEVIVLAEILIKDIKDVFFGIYYVLPNGIKTMPNSSKKKTDRIMFIYLSNLMKDKGILVFLEAIKKIQFLKEEFNVSIIGPSADVLVEDVKEFLSKNKISNCIVTGAVYGEEKYTYLKQSDVFVLPTFYRNECFPLTILEAFQAGLAVISTNNGAIANMINDNYNGFIVSKNNINQLAEKMNYLIKNKKELNKIKNNNTKEFLDKYTEEIFIDNFISIIKKSLK